MKIHAIMVIKNEADIIEYALRAAAGWADRIYVFDTGSSDETWSRVLASACACTAIVPYKSESRPFDDQLRAEVFRAYRHEAESGSWWCRLDSDEVYAEDPRAFLRAVPSYHHVVWATHAQYYFTTADVSRFPSAGRSPPRIDESNRPRYYLTNASEPRFFRHRSRLQWDQGAWPRHLGVVHPRRILLRHFQYRSPQQIQLRLDTRRAAAASGWAHFGHSLQANWQEQLRDSKELHFDHGDALIVDQALPRHLESRWRRWMKLVLHGSGIWP